MSEIYLAKHHGEEIGYQPRRWRNEIYNHRHSIMLSLVFLVLAVFFDFLAGRYVMKVPSVVAPDLILDHIPTISFISPFFVYGYVIIIAVLLLYPLFFKVNELHRVINQFSLLVMVRAAFTCFTHLQSPSDAASFTVPWIIASITFQNDLFFSGHTAVTFLGFLLFRKEKIGYFFLVASILMAITVLLMHVHYTIDVLSAFFITYGTFNIGKWFYKSINHY